MPWLLLNPPNVGPRAYVGTERYGHQAPHPQVTKGSEDLLKLPWVLCLKRRRHQYAYVRTGVQVGKERIRVVQILSRTVRTYVYAGAAHYASLRIDDDGGVLRSVLRHARAK